MTMEDDDLNQEDFASMLEESLEPRSFEGRRAGRRHRRIGWP